MRLLPMLFCAIAGWCQMQRHVVFVDLDGVRRDLLESAYLAGRMPQLERLFGSAAGQGFPAALYFEQATTVAPTVTMSGQASLFTGVYPGRHGIAGNEWFDRDASKLIDYMSTTGAACVYGYSLFGTLGCRGGRANNDLTVPALYESASNGGKSSVVIYNQYWKGATRVIEPSVIDALVLLQSGDLDVELFDRSVAEHAIQEMLENGRPGILTVYFAGADAAGHARGTTAAMDYLSRVIDPLLGSIFGALDAMDPRWRSNTLFVFSADHGRTDAIGTPADQLALSQAARVLAREGFDSQHAQIASEGGLAHVYLRPAEGAWREVPDTAALHRAAQSLAADGALVEELEAVCYRDGNYVCLPPLEYSRGLLLDRLNSRRTGDLLLIAKPGRYFGNSKAEGAEHGALDATDLAVPLILAGGGVRPGRVSEPVATVQIAATIAEFLGFDAEGVQPQLPGVVFHLPWMQKKAASVTSPAAER